MSISSATNNNTSTAMNSIYSAITSRNTGIGGLVSGLDTDSLVEAMTMSTRNKIAKQQQNKTLLQWKQSAYRDISKSIKNFEAKYFTIGSSNDMTGSGYYNVYKGTSSSDAITVTPDVTSSPGTLEIEYVKQLATNTTITSSKVQHELNSADIDLFDLLNDPATPLVGQTLTLRLDDKTSATYTIDLGRLYEVTSDPTWGLSDAGDQALIEDKLQALITEKVGEKGVADGTNNKVPIISISIDWSRATAATPGLGSINFDSGLNKTSIVGDCTILGLDAGQSNRVTTSLTLEELFPDLTQYGVTDYTFTINGITIEATADMTLSKLMTAVNNSGANVSLSFDSATQTIKLARRDPGEFDIEVADVQGELMNKIFGALGGNTFTSATVTPGSISYNYDTQIKGDPLSGVSPKDIIDDLAVNGGQIKLTINGDDYILGFADIAVQAFRDSVEDAIQAHMDTWNLSNGNLPPTASAYQTELTAITEQYYKDGLEQLFNDTIEDQIGPGIVTFSFDDTPGNEWMVFATDANTTLVIDNAVASGDPENIFEKYFKPLTPGIAVDNIPVPETSTPLYSLLSPPPSAASGNITITVDGNPVTFTYNNATTILQFKSEIESVGGTLTLAADGSSFTIDLGQGVVSSFSDSQGSNGLMEALFGTDNFTTAPADLSNTTVKKELGQNAEIVVDGQVMFSHNNKFQLNGIAFEVNEETTAADGVITLVMTPDLSGFVSKFSDFIDDYNTLYSTILGVTNERKARDDDGTTYPPLTEDQKNDMTEKEIEEWETKAKQGLLGNDTILTRFLNQIRATLYYDKYETGLSPYMFGLTTSSMYNTASKSVTYENSGQIILDEDKLLEALEQNGDLVALTFREMSTSLSAIMNDMARESSTDPGLLVSLAGTGDNSIGLARNSLDDRIGTIDKYIARLKLRLESEYKRYWKKFTALETAIANMSSQTSWLSELE